MNNFPKEKEGVAAIKAVQNMLLAADSANLELVITAHTVNIQGIDYPDSMTNVHKAYKLLKAAYDFSNIKKLPSTIPAKNKPIVPDNDGWINNVNATDAPNLAEGTVVEVVFRDGVVSEGEPDDYWWVDDGDHCDIVKWRVKR